MNSPEELGILRMLQHRRSQADRDVLRRAAIEGLADLYVAECRDRLAYSRFGVSLDSPLFHESTGPYLPSSRKKIAAPKSNEQKLPNYEKVREEFWQTSDTSRDGVCDSSRETGTTVATAPLSNDDYLRECVGYWGKDQRNGDSLEHDSRRQAKEARRVAERKAKHQAKQAETEANKDAMRERLAAEEARWQAETETNQAEAEARRRHHEPSGGTFDAQQRRRAEKECKKRERRRRHAESARRMNDTETQGKTVREREQGRSASIRSADAGEDGMAKAIALRKQFTKSSQPIIFEQVPWLPIPVTFETLGVQYDVVDVKRKAVRSELKFWHPDKWQQRYQQRLALGGDSERILASVTDTARRLTELVATLDL